VRLPMHYDRLTLPVDQEPVAGRDTWNEEGFAEIDALLAWVKANGMYLILDLHAAPGGQGSDLAISDRDPSKPSLWDSAENRRKTVALWRRLAERYADEPAIGAYDLINEPNWDFEKPGGGHGCEETTNAPLRSLMREITTAIREVDPRHMIVIEGNCWGNNYRGVTPLWDDNTVISFHKYWNATDRASIADILRLRDETNAPVWLGESGENSNTWFTETIALVEGEGIGWAFWPLKKIGFNQPLEIAPNPGWPRLVAYLTGKGPRPSAQEAQETLMRLATHDIRFENNVEHRDVVDAMLRQPRSDAAVPYTAHRIGAAGATLRAADYDLGRSGVAWKDVYDADTDGPGERIPWWNTGRTWRNDGVDIGLDGGAPVVVEFETGEWLRYTVTAQAAGDRRVTVVGAGGRVSVSLNGGAAAAVDLPTDDGWREGRAVELPFMAGTNTLILKAEDCGACRVKEIQVGG
ncbi:MAG: cellulase family glycosylhydrolase, partial [Phenylobacterium sp.]|nr:cellulase family glycosylhydrolase [Phenylobacterium sp.]